ncbi:autotransporter-associated beta strand repeat-containing protein, partial [Acetobacter malorum]|uniref:autotransporter-associated beta strand repeat-containing protein n=1 Tax=Acetobacter malorum TaxID=178901 RepID=UPI000793FA5D
GGALDVAAGTETLSGAQAGQAALGVEAGADLDIAGAVSARTLAGAGDVTLQDGSALTLKGDGSFAGDIAGAGALTVEGQQVLSGTSGWTGGTDIASGAGLTVADTATHAAGLAGAVTDDGSLTLDNTTDPTHSTTLAGDITGAGAVIAKDGALTLAGANSFSGGLRGENAAITATTASLGTGGVALDGGSLTLAQDTDGATADAITGTGSLIKTGRGTLTLSAASSFMGGTAIQSGTVAITDGAALGTGAVQDDAALTLALGADGTVANAISGTGTIEKTGSSSVTLTGENSYGGGTTISGGTLAGAVGAFGTGQIKDNATLVLDGSGALANTVSGTGSLIKTGAGDLALTGENTFTGGLDIASGSVTAAVSGLGAGAIRDDGSLTVRQDTAGDLAGDMSGTGRLTKEGTGTLSLTGTNSYTGTTEVAAGTLRVDGDSSAATGALTVDGGAALGGTGTLGGSVTVQSGATLTPGDAGAGTLTIGGSLTLADGATTQYDLDQPGVAGGAQNDLVKVGGDLHLGGTLNVTTDPTSGAALADGVYRLYEYGGALSGTQSVSGSLPIAGGDAAGMQTSVSGQVNLVISSMNTEFWNGGGKADGTLTGGTGNWQAGGSGWTNAAADVDGKWNVGAMAIFEGQAGNVAVDDSAGRVSVGSMQFANADGQSYVLSGDTLYAAGQTLGINVGDGTAAGAGIRAEIDSTIDDSQVAGGAQLIKTGLGRRSYWPPCRPRPAPASGRHRSAPPRCPA